MKTRREDLEGSAKLPWWGNALLVTLLAAILAHIVWRASYFLRGETPPTLLSVFGIADPFDDLDGSLSALVRGDWRESLRLHPLTVPIFALAGWTLFDVLRNWRRERSFDFSMSTAYWWIAMLLVAWFAKLLP